MRLYELIERATRDHAFATELHAATLRAAQQGPGPAFNELLEYFADSPKELGELKLRFAAGPGALPTPQQTSLATGLMTTTTTATTLQCAVTTLTGLTTINWYPDTGETPQQVS